MNTHTFDNHYLTCPICQKNATPKPVKSCVGLFSCPYCQERLVVSQSGHYVRDPFILKQIMLSSALRRQSSPVARILRDFMLLRPIVALAIGGAIVFGMITATQQNTNYDNQNLHKTEKINQKFTQPQ